jgi:hypothetical protein
VEDLLLADAQGDDASLGLAGGKEQREQAEPWHRTAA